MSFADQIKDLALPDVPPRAAEFPRIYWRNGNKQARTPGFFYTKADEFPDGVALSTKSLFRTISSS